MPGTWKKTQSRRRLSGFPPPLRPAQRYSPPSETKPGSTDSGNDADGGLPQCAGGKNHRKDEPVPVAFCFLLCFSSFFILFLNPSDGNIGCSSRTAQRSSNATLCEGNRPRPSFPAGRGWRRHWRNLSLF